MMRATSRPFKYFIEEADRQTCCEVTLLIQDDTVGGMFQPVKLLDRRADLIIYDLR
jgi:hypothetical protein